MLNRRGFFGTVLAALGLVREAPLTLRVNMTTPLTIDPLTVKTGQAVTIQNVGKGDVILQKLYFASPDGQYRLIATRDPRDGPDTPWIYK